MLLLLVETRKAWYKSLGFGGAEQKALEQSSRREAPR